MVNSMEFICFTASKGGVGVSQIVAQTAIALSVNGKKCLAVDFCFKRRTLDIYIKCEDSFVFDISDVFDGRCSFEDALTKADDNLFFLACSQTKDIVDYSKALDLVYQNASDFDFVLVDMPYKNCCYDKFTKTILVTNCDAASVRCTEKLAQDLQNDKKYLIINKIDTELIQSGFHMNVDDICDMCGVAPIGLVPYEHGCFTKNTNAMHKRCCIAFENISQRLCGSYVCAIDFSTPKKTKKLFSRR